MAKHRIERVAERIKQELSDIITYKLKDPRVGFVTITRVKVAPDMTKATVFLSVMGQGSQENTTMRALKHARGHIQTELSGRIRLRRHPEIQFKIDEGYKKSLKVSHILAEIGAEDPAPEAGQEPAAGNEKDEADP